MNKQIERVNVFISRAASIRVESHLRLYLEIGCARVERRSVTRNRGRGSIKRPDIEYPEHGSRYSLLRELCSSPPRSSRASHVSSVQQRYRLRAAAAAVAAAAAAATAAATAAAAAAAVLVQREDPA